MYKCANCGKEINETEDVCYNCGYHINNSPITHIDKNTTKEIQFDKLEIISTVLITIMVGLYVMLTILISMLKETNSDIIGLYFLGAIPIGLFICQIPAISFIISIINMKKHRKVLSCIEIIFNILTISIIYYWGNRINIIGSILIIAIIASSIITIINTVRHKKNTK